MLIFITGISGSGKQQYINEVQDIARDKGQTLDIYHLGDTMYHAAAEIGHPITDGRILDVGPPLLDYLRTIAIKDIMLKMNPNNINIILTASCFRWNKFLMRAFDVSQLQELKPDIYITIIDNIKSVHERQQNSPQWRGKLEPFEVLLWRDEEIFVSQTLAQFQRKPHYVISKNESAKTLFNLIFNQYMHKMYLSYPITNIEKTKPEFFTDLQHIGDVLRKSFIVFDPLTIKDLDPAFTLKNLDRKFIEDDTVIRDYTFITQSDFVVVIYPVNERSLGVAAEMRLAKTLGKKVYAYIEEGSPFGIEFYDKAFNTLDDLFEFLSASYGVRLAYNDSINQR